VLRPETREAAERDRHRDATMDEFEERVQKMRNEEYGSTPLIMRQGK